MKTTRKEGTMSAPRPYELEKPEEVERLLRETASYLRVSLNHGTDTEGRRHALTALGELQQLHSGSADTISRLSRELEEARFQVASTNRTHLSAEVERLQEGWRKEHADSVTLRGEMEEAKRFARVSHEMAITYARQREIYGCAATKAEGERDSLQAELNALKKLTKRSTTE